MLLFVSVYMDQNFAAGIFLSILFAVSLIAPILYDFRKRRRFYQQVTDSFEQLDQKTLLAELITHPDFLEGQVLYDIIYKTNKSYLEEIRKYHDMQEDYREYIELWIHEIKTPISSAVLTIENHASQENDTLLSDLSLIEDYAMQALFYARSNTVEKDYLIQEISLRDVCLRVIRKNAKHFIEHNITIDADEIEGQVYCDTKWIIYILEQILNNAVKYARENNPKIIMRSEISANSVSLFISDNGLGIKRDELSRVCEKGFTGTIGRRYEKSTGMGLYLSKKLCDKLGLGLTIDSEGTGKGTQVKIVFPRSSHITQVLRS